ncbi:MAG TPA: hypothetical protein VE057_26005 [Archangium sp.]|nr:hypothetical protein [Archangium sp.]
MTTVHMVEQVLPHVPYRQWTLSFPHRVRWVLLKDVGLLSDVLTVFLRAVFALLGLGCPASGNAAGYGVSVRAFSMASAKMYARRALSVAPRSTSCGAYFARSSVALAMACPAK